MSLLVLLLTESALETVPKNLWSHPAVKRHSEKRGKPPRLLLLDRSYHHSAMRKLEGSEHRGRPDIVHFALLEALSTPLNREGLLRVYVHTANDYVVTVNSETRLPRNYDRFVGLMEQLFERGRVPAVGQPLLRLDRKTPTQLLEDIKTDYVMAFSRKGAPNTLEESVSRLSDKGQPAVIVGGFPRGHFSDEIVRLADEVVSVDPEMLETWTITSRVIYEYERSISLLAKRLK